MDVTVFRRDYLNHMDGREIERVDNKNRLSEYRRKMINRIQAPLFKSLTHREDILDEELKSINSLELELEELWRKP